MVCLPASVTALGLRAAPRRASSDWPADHPLLREDLREERGHAVDDIAARERSERWRETGAIRNARPSRGQAANARKRRSGKDGAAFHRCRQQG